MKFLFRVDADSKIGSGHLMRCLALAQTLVEMRAEVVFCVSEQTARICKSRHDWLGQIMTLPDLTIAEELSWLTERLPSRDVSAVILDGYQFDSEYRKQLKAHYQYLFLFDDLNNSGPLHADIIVNAAADAHELGYAHISENAKLCLGDAYRSLRQEFMYCNYDDWGDRKDLVISFGGSDSSNLTLGLFKALEAQGASMPIRVITGPAYPYLAELKLAIYSSNMVVQHLHNCQHMADVFCHAKLAVCAAGGTQYELQACATASLLLIVADNQRPATAGAAKQGWCEVVDGSEGLDFGTFARQAIQLWQDEARLQLMHNRAMQVRNVNGCHRIAVAIKEMINSR